jgi:hypothetical protein
MAYKNRYIDVILHTETSALAQKSFMRWTDGVQKDWLNLLQKLYDMD